MVENKFKIFYAKKSIETKITLIAVVIIDIGKSK